MASEGLRSFLIRRIICVKIVDSLSDLKELLYGVPQGSVLGPRLFNKYSNSIHKHVEPSHFEIEGFADDH